jgi:hypothetical protein
MTDQKDERTERERKDRERQEAEDREREEAHRRANMATGACMVIFFGNT